MQLNPQISFKNLTGLFFGLLAISLFTATAQGAMNVVLNDAELTAEITAANGSLREVMNRVKRLARRKQSASKV